MQSCYIVTCITRVTCIYSSDRFHGSALLFYHNHRHHYFPFTTAFCFYIYSYCPIGYKKGRYISYLPIPVDARSKAWVCDRSLAMVTCSHPAGGMNVCLLWLLCVTRWRFLSRYDHSSRGVLNLIVKPR